LNAFLAAALLRVVRAVPVQALASASVVSSATVRGFDTAVKEITSQNLWSQIKVAKGIVIFRTLSLYSISNKSIFSLSFS